MCIAFFVLTAVSAVAVAAPGVCAGNKVFERNLYFESRLYPGECTAVARRNDCYGHSLGVGAACASDAVYIILGFTRHIVVYNHGYIVDIYAAGQKVGGYEHIQAFGSEIVDSVISFLLSEIGVYLCAVSV